MMTMSLVYPMVQKRDPLEQRWIDGPPLPDAEELAEFMMKFK